eukprot:Opistho-2@18006
MHIEAGQCVCASREANHLPTAGSSVPAATDSSTVFRDCAAASPNDTALGFQKACPDRSRWLSAFDRLSPAVRELLSSDAAAASQAIGAPARNCNEFVLLRRKTFFIAISISLACVSASFRLRLTRSSGYIQRRYTKPPAAAATHIAGTAKKASFLSVTTPMSNTNAVPNADMYASAMGVFTHAT